MTIFCAFLFYPGTVRGEEMSLFSTGQTNHNSQHAKLTPQTGMESYNLLFTYHFVVKALN